MITERDTIAQSTAEYIANVLIPQHDEYKQNSGPYVTYVNMGRPMPRTVEAIKAELLAGACYISWLDDRVRAAMSALHDEDHS